MPVYLEDSAGLSVFAAGGLFLGEPVGFFVQLNGHFIKRLPIHVTRRIFRKPATVFCARPETISILTHARPIQQIKRPRLDLSKVMVAVEPVAVEPPLIEH